MLQWLPEPAPTFLGADALAGRITVPVKIQGREVDALVDTGSTTMSIPEDVAVRLGIPVTGSRQVRVASGAARVGFIEALSIEVLGRSMTTDCLVMPPGIPALIGRRQLEELDLIILPRRGEVRHNTLGAVALPSDWFTSGCGSGPRVRWLPNGAIEIEGQETPERALPDGVAHWAQEIHAASAKHGVPWNLTAGIMALESGGKQDAKSPANACGLMQLIPSTASNQAGRLVTCDELLKDAKLNVDLGTKLLAELMQKYGGNVVKVSAAYNAGGAYCGAGKKCTSPNKWNLVTDCGSSGQGVDYPGIVIGYANAALKELPAATSPAAISRAFNPVAVGLGIGAVALAYYLVTS